MANSAKPSFYDDEIFDSPPFQVKLLRRYLKFLNCISSKKAYRKVVNLFMTPRIDQQKIIERYHELKLFENGETLYHGLQDHEIFVYKEGTTAVLLTYAWEIDHRSSFKRLRID